MSEQARPGRDDREILVLRVFVGTTEVDQQAFTKETLVIGRDPYADVYLEDPTVSRLHASIKREGHRLILVDHSSNGTVVNGKNANTHMLSNGDEISAGRFRVRVEVHSDARLSLHQMARSKGPDEEEEQTIRRAS